MPLTSAKAADLLGLSARQTRRLARAGRIVGASLLGRDWVFEHPLKVLPPDRTWPIPPVLADWRALEDSNL